MKYFAIIFLMSVFFNFSSFASAPCFESGKKYDARGFFGPSWHRYYQFLSLDPINEPTFGKVYPTLWFDSRATDDDAQSRVALNLLNHQFNSYEFYVSQTIILDKFNHDFVESRHAVVVEKGTCKAVVKFLKYFDDGT